MQSFFVHFDKQLRSWYIFRFEFHCMYCVYSWIFMRQSCCKSCRLLYWILCELKYQLLGVPCRIFVRVRINISTSMRSWHLQLGNLNFVHELSCWVELRLYVRTLS